MRTRIMRRTFAIAGWLCGVLLAVAPGIGRAQAPFPFFEGFESGAFSNYWAAKSTGNGRIRIIDTSGPLEGQCHAALDATNYNYGLNELVLTADLTGQSNVFFDCWIKDFYSDPEVMPTQFEESVNAEGIAVSEDGVVWYKLADFKPQSPRAYSNIAVDLSAFAGAHDFVLNDRFKIKFQQYDYDRLESGGYVLDHVQLYDRAQAADVSLTLAAAPNPVAVGSNLVYSLVVSNCGPLSASNVILTNQMSTNVTLISVEAVRDSWTTNGNDIVFELGEVAWGESVAAQIVVQPRSVGYFTNTAVLAAPGFDPNPFNNRRSATTYADYEGGDLFFSVPSIATEEGRSTIALTVQRTNRVAGAVSFSFETVDGTAMAGTDYQSRSGIITLNNGETSYSWTIPIVNDEVAEEEENFSVHLSNPTGGATLVAPSNVTISIRDEDGIAPYPFTEDFESGVLSNYWKTYSSSSGWPQPSTNDSPHGGRWHVNMNSRRLYYSLNELILNVDLSGQEGVYLRFWHRRQRNESDDLMSDSFMNHTYADGVAISANGTDWYKLHGLTVAETGTNEYRQLDVALDPVLTANGLNYSSRMFIKFQMYGTYYPPNYGRFFDDISFYTQSGNLRLGASSWETPEAAGAVTVTVERVQGDSGEVSVDYATLDGSAQAGSDYEATTGTLVFANGVRSQSFAVPVIQDGDVEPQESFSVRLSNPVGGAVLTSPPQAVVTVLDDDGPGEFNFSAAQYSEAENNGYAGITVNRLYGSVGDVSVDYRTQSGTATAGLDYVETAGVLYFCEGTGQRVFEVPLLDDALMEGSETVLLFLSNPQNGATLGALTNTVLVIMDDEAPRASFPFYDGFESGTWSNYWSVRSTGAGRVRMTNEATGFEGSRSMTMDSASDYALNEATLTVDLAGQTGVLFRCWTRDFTDSPHPMPASFTGSTNADGIAVSADGISWHRLVDLSSNSAQAVYTNIVCDLAAFAAEQGLIFTPTFQIKFQQYDNGAATARGRTFDHISLSSGPCATCTVIRSQGFEGNASDTWDFGIVPKLGQIALLTNRMHSGARSLRLLDAPSVKTDPFIEFDNVDISSFNHVFLSVAFSASGPDIGDDLYLELSYDNGLTWNGAGTVELVDGYRNAEIPFGGTLLSNPTTVSNNPWIVSIPSGRSQVKARVHFTQTSVNSSALDSYFVDRVVLGYEPTNQPPRLLPVGDRIALVSNRLEFAVTADDIDHNAIDLVASNLPPGAVFDAVTGPGPVSNMFQFVPDVSQADAVYTVTFNASDGDGSDAETITIQVLDKAVAFSTNRFTTSEDAGSQEIGVSLSRSADAVVHLACGGGAAAGADGDFTLSSTSLTFALDGPSEQVVTVQLNDDLLAEGVETILLCVSNSPDVRADAASCELFVRDNDSITIASANLTSGGSFFYTEPGTRILRAVQPDITAIQEFNVTNAVGYREYVDEYFGTGFSYYVETGVNLPNGVVSRWPIIAAGTWEDPQLSDREFMWATVDVPGGRSLHLLSVHLHASGGSSSREIEARMLTNYLASAGFHPADYVVVCGDFNTQNRSEAAVQVLTTALRDDRRPADQYGDTDTNQNRDKPYDYVLPNPLLNSRHIPVNFGGAVFSEGLVFDTRLWAGGEIPYPAQAADSAALSMQHMAVMKGFALDRFSTLLARTGEGGSIVPTNVEVGLGSNQIFTLTADPYYHIGLIATNAGAWTPDGQLGSLGWVWSNVQANGWLDVSFEENRAIYDVPERWLARHRLTNGSWDVEALDDQDEDGFAAWQEYVADTDPTNRASRLEILEVAGESTRWITFVSSTARVYSAQYSDEAQWPEGWTTLAEGFAVSNRLTTVSDPGGSGLRIYRIQVRLPGQ